MRISLGWKLLLGCLSVAAVGILTFTLLVNRSTTREVRLAMGGRLDGTPQLVVQLGAYYRGRGSWAGVENLFMGPAMAEHMGAMMGRGVMPGLPVLADAQGRVLIGGPGGRTAPLTPDERRNAFPIVVDGSVVGYLLPLETGVPAAERELADRVNKAIAVAALASLAAALIGAALLTAGMLRPVRELTTAARSLSEGDLSRRVRVHTQDEIGELSLAFNQMGDSLQRAEGLRRDMTADVAHELRNPLAVMQARVEAVMDGVYPPTPENLQPILEQTRLLNRLVEDLRTLALADAGQLPLNQSQVDLAGLVGRTVNTYRAQAQAAGVELTLQLPAADEIRVDADPGRIEQVVGNLLTNGLRHAPRGSQVEIGLSLRGSRARLEVIDHGEGIPAEALPFVFERFYRSDSSRAREYGGTGLGLAISRQIVQAHGGTIAAANRPEGGASFVVELPLSGG